MKNSEKYRKAMVAVIDCFHITAEEKIGILEKLLEDESVAKYLERRAEEEAIV